MPTSLAEILGRFIQREHTSVNRVATLAKVPKKTITNWLEGKVRRPRQWQDLLMVAAVLHLDESDTSALLVAAGYPVLNELRTRLATETERRLFAVWSPPPTGPFQAIARVPYFVGRDSELRHVSRLVLHSRYVALCNLHGMGGVGKTALAAHLAYHLRPHFPDGVLWARLDTTDTLSILSAFAAAYDRDVSAYTDLESRSSVVRGLLADKHVLIVLDNAETSAQVRPLLPASTGKPAVIVTTRHILEATDGWAQLAVEPFEPQSRDVLVLFEKLIGPRRARRHQAAIAEIGQLLGHLPLALALVASRLATQPDEAIPDLVNRLRLDGGRLEELRREDRSVRLSFDASYDSLPPDLQVFFPSLGAFGGEDFGVEAVAYVTETPIEVTTNQLDRLVRLSLVQSSRSGRYRLHPLLRDYAREKLIGGEAYLRTLDFFVTTIERLGSTDYHSLELEIGNILAALDAVRERRSPVQFIRGVTILSDLLQACGLYALLDTYLVHAEDAARALADRHLLASVWLHRGKLKMEQGDLPHADTFLKMGLALTREVGDRACECDLLLELGRLRFYVGEDQESKYYAGESLAIARELNNLVAILKCVGNLGVCVAKLGDYQQAEEHFRTSLTLARQMGRHETEITMLQNLAWLAWQRRSYAQADVFSLEAATLARSTGRREALIGVLGNHSQSCFARGDVAQAEGLMREALRIAREIGHQRSIPDMLADLGVYAYRVGDVAQAAEYWRESLQLARQTGNLGLVSRVLTHQAEQQLACGQLGEAETIAQAALSQARQISNQELMADALFALAQVALARDHMTVAADYGYACLALMEAANPRRSNDVRQWLDKVQLSK